MAEAPKMYLIPADVRANLLAYLLERPYKEVANGVKWLNELQEVPTEQAPADEPKACPRLVPVEGKNEASV